MKKKLSVIFALLLSLLLLASCAGGGNGTTEKVTDEKLETSEEQGSDVTDESSEEKSEATEETTEKITEKETEMTEENTEKLTEETTEEQGNTAEWYIDSSSVQTVFEYGEKFNYDGIVAIHNVDGEKIEYPEDDLYVEHAPKLLYPGEYTVSVEVLPEEIIVTYTITVKDVDPSVVLANASTVTVGGDKTCKLEFESIDLSHIKSNGKLLVDDQYASGGKYVQNYDAIGNCFGFKVVSDGEVVGAKLVLRMANFAVTMIYPAENLALYQNYVNINENTKLEFDPDYYLTTRAPTTAGQEGADTSLVWCEVVIENITLSEGENTFMFAVIGNETPFLDCAEIIIP